MSDARKRDIYDQFGEEGLYGDVPPEDEDFFDKDSTDDRTDDYSDYCQEDN